MTAFPAKTLIGALLLATACTQAAPPPAEPAKASVTPVLATAETILGQPIAYPAGAPAEVTAVIVTLPPGAKVGWHHHPVPLFGYMLEGELTVSYKLPDGTTTERIYRPGEALIEAIDIPHDGRNNGDSDARILAVFLGAEGIPNSEKEE